MRIAPRAVLAALGLAAGCARPSAAPTAEYFPLAGRPDLPFSEVVRVGTLLFVSGQIGMDSTGRTLVPGGIGPETTQALANLRAVLLRHGSSMDQVVKCTALLADMREWNAMNAVYAPYFPRNFPARTAVGGVSLVFGARVEFDCVAVVPAG